ncbi:MAG: sugar transferase [Bacteroidales bacterium]|nr:sugar transferase [Bacteroidales bacterium]
MVKRIFDIIAALAGLLVLSPLIILLCIIIPLDSKGSPFFCQKRVGRHNRDFSLYKFRTMRKDSDKAGLLTVGGKDSRITRIGYWLRKFKIDEIPQLINILKGEMSVVGPRPEVRKYVNMYTPHQMQVLEVRPGLTDLASIKYVNENEILGQSSDPEKTYIEKIMPEKIELNLQYIENQSIIYDIELIFKTFAAILKK